MQTLTPDFASNIARCLISLKAVGYNLLQPFHWASGTFNPFYVDNRKLQSNVNARKILRIALASLVEDPKAISCIYGIPKAGIAPAVLLCLELNKPLLIKFNDEYYKINLETLKLLVKENTTSLMKSAEVIAGTMPFGTILGLVQAEILEKPFLFVRPKPKNHGLFQQVEGIKNPGDYCVLVDPLIKGHINYTTEAALALTEEKITTTALFQPHFDPFLHSVELKDMGVVCVEDLVSTGGSSLDEIALLQKTGAKVEPVSIFSYSLHSAVKNFAEYGLINKSVLDFYKLAKEFDQQNIWKSWADKNRIEEWFYDQENWGEKNGFPRKFT